MALGPVLVSGCALLAVVSATVDEIPPEDSIPTDARFKHERRNQGNVRGEIGGANK